MKILMVSNLYPPFYKGGYEVRCAQVAEAMHRAGHEVRVLTATFGLPLSALGSHRPKTEDRGGVRIDRSLYNCAFDTLPPLRPWTFFHARRELKDARQFQRILGEFRPDVVNWWNMNGLTKLMLPLPASFKIPDIHWIEYPWMIDEYGAAGEKMSSFWINLWDGQWGPKPCQSFFRWIGRRWERGVEQEGLPTRHFPNDPTHVCFVSEYLRTLYREGGLEFSSSEILYGGVPTEQFYQPIRVDRDPLAPIRVLYAGQITPDRGLHTAVEAIGHMPSDLRSRVTLSVAGPNSGSYFEQVQRRVEDLGLSASVTFFGKVPHEQMPRIYKSHDILVFLSTREEGLPLVMVEAMIAGCAVLTTGSGGAMEIAQLADLPLIPKGDYQALSQILSRYVTAPTVITETASRGQRVAFEEFSLGRMMERWEATLQRLRQIQR
ncbi:MAG: glycosyltransferase family 4 protein [Nitrospiraceae bacterium]